MKIIERIFNAETNETIDLERDMTAQEKTERQEAEANAAKQKVLQVEAEAKKATAAAKLAELGLTADDLKVLGLA